MSLFAAFSIGHAEAFGIGNGDSLTYGISAVSHTWCVVLAEGLEACLTCSCPAMMNLMSNNEINANYEALHCCRPAHALGYLRASKGCLWVNIITDSGGSREES